MDENPGTLEDFRTTLEGTPKEGYCSRSLQDFNKLGNSELCLEAETEKLAYHYGIEFGIKNAETVQFNFQCRFEYGGWSVLDGEI